MKDQHKQITGYRDLTQGEIDAVNELKSVYEEIALILDDQTEKYDVDRRSQTIAMTKLQESAMWAIRSITKPGSRF